MRVASPVASESAWAPEYTNQNIVISGFSPSGCIYTVQLAGLGEKIQTTLINLESDRVNNSLLRNRSYPVSKITF